MTQLVTHQTFFLPLAKGIFASSTSCAPHPSRRINSSRHNQGKSAKGKIAIMGAGAHLTKSHDAELATIHD